MAVLDTDHRTMSIAAPFPRMPLLSAGALVAFALTMALYGRAAGLGKPAVTGAPTAERSLRFDDRADGAVIVSLGQTGQRLDVMTGQNGFLRGTLRGFARIRRSDGVGSGPPLLLSGYANGQLILSDPTTGRHVELEAFGSENEAVFVRLLTMKPPAQTAQAGQAHG
jgi:putative photosynthetic complex assembly protein